MGSGPHARPWIEPSDSIEVTRLSRRSSTPFTTASVAIARGAVNGHTMPSPGISKPARAPGPRCGSIAYSSSPLNRRRPRHPLAAAFSSITGSWTTSSSFQATRQAPVCSTGMPTSAAYALISAYPRATSRASIDPGAASKPVCRMAVLALLVPVPTSGPASTRTVRRSKADSARATAAPTTPAPITATSNTAAMPLLHQGDGALEPLSPVAPLRLRRAGLDDPSRPPHPESLGVVLRQADGSGGPEADPPQRRFRFRRHLDRNAAQLRLHPPQGRAAGEASVDPQPADRES